MVISYEEVKEAAFYNKRGVACRRAGSYEHAILYYNQALAIKPDFAEAFNNRATAFYFLNKYDQAWADIERCERAGGTPNPELVWFLHKVKLHCL